MLARRIALSPSPGCGGCLQTISGNMQKWMPKRRTRSMNRLPLGFSTAKRVPRWKAASSVIHCGSM